jgi:glycosidase
VTALTLGLLLLENGVLTRPVAFEFTAPEANSVCVAGSFNFWSKTASPMRRSSGTWRATLELPVGRHQYKFVVDGAHWFLDPKAETVDDGMGNKNSVILVVPADYGSRAAVGDGAITPSPLWHSTEAARLSYDRGRLRLTVRTRAGDVQRVVLVTTGGERRPLALSHSDELFSHYTVEVPWDQRQKFAYRFLVSDGPTTMTLPRDGGWHEVDPKGLALPSPPPWVERAVFYQIFPDRFANGDPGNDPADVENWETGAPTYTNWFGGDLAGVRSRMGHLKALGVTAVYWNPVFKSPSNHRYDTSDYMTIDPRLGTNEEFSALTREMERSGIRTVLDGVFNHTATDFPAFAAILRDQRRAATRDWYTVRSWPVRLDAAPTYEAWSGFGAMPKLNHANPEVRRTVRGVVEHWQERAAVHGWRLDVAPEVPMEFWREFRSWVKTDPDRWIVGEMWGDASPWLKGDQWDSTMNYQFRNSVLRFVAKGAESPRAFWDDLMRVHHAYGPRVSRNLLNLISSHDVPRILTECGGDARLARLAAMLLFTWVGAPCVYYGDEIGMEGGPDPDNRRPMDWRRATADNPFLSLYARLARIRNASPALQSGDPMLLAADERTRTLAFARVAAQDVRVVVVNRCERPRTVRLALPRDLADRARPATEWYCSLSGASAKASQGRLTVAVPPVSLVVLSPRSGSEGSASSRAAARHVHTSHPSCLAGEAIHRR